MHKLSKHSGQVKEVKLSVLFVLYFSLCTLQLDGVSTLLSKVQLDDFMQNLLICEQFSFIIHSFIYL